MVPIGSQSQRSIRDYFVSRLGGYLIAMNGDPSKPPIAEAQIYFAIQTRRQEVSDNEAALDKRIGARLRLTDSTKRLNSAAKQVGVSRFGIFTDEDYKGLYGGKGAKQIHELKGMPEHQHLFDRLGHAELAAHDFRVTQAEERLRRETVAGEHDAFRIH